MFTARHSPLLDGGRVVVLVLSEEEDRRAAPASRRPRASCKTSFDEKEARAQENVRDGGSGDETCEGGKRPFTALEH